MKKVGEIFKSEIEVLSAIKGMVSFFEMGETIDEDINLQFKVVDTGVGYKVTAYWLLNIEFDTSTQDPTLQNEPIETWDDDYFTILKTESHIKFSEYVLDVLEKASVVKIDL